MLNRSCGNRSSPAAFPSEWSLGGSQCVVNGVCIYLRKVLNLATTLATREPRCLRAGSFSGVLA